MMGDRVWNEREDIPHPRLCREIDYSHCETIVTAKEDGDLVRKEERRLCRHLHAGDDEPYPTI